jgi:hypothetical protein
MSQISRTFQNGCVLHQAGEMGEMENYSFLRGLICLRFPGEVCSRTGFAVTLSSEGAARLAKLFGRNGFGMSQPRRTYRLPHTNCSILTWVNAWPWISCRAQGSGKAA